jgi:hypothetical protein
MTDPIRLLQPGIEAAILSVVPLGLWPGREQLLHAIDAALSRSDRNPDAADRSTMTGNSAVRFHCKRLK